MAGLFDQQATVGGKLYPCRRDGSVVLLPAGVDPLVGNYLFIHGGNSFLITGTRSYRGHTEVDVEVSSG